MTSARIKEVLAASYPGADRRGDPELEEALKLVERDPELARWFENQKAVDSAVRRKLRDIPIPVGLRTRILRNSPKSRAWFRRWGGTSFVSAAAAAFLVAGGAFAWLNPLRPASWADYQAKMVEEATEPYEITTRTNDLGVVRSAMAKQGYPADYRLPKGLETYPIKGGRKLRWRGENVSVVCFGAERSPNPDTWLVVVARRPLPGAPVDGTPKFATADGHPIATWADAQHYYIVTTSEGGPDLKAIF